MTKADEVVKVRVAAQQASDAARKEQTGKEEIEARMQYLADAIPRLLALLESRDYPDAVLLNVRAPSPRGLFGRQPRYIQMEMAAWVLDEDRWSDGSSVVHLLSDGRISATGIPVAVTEIPVQYSEEGAIHWLRRASGGVERLIEEYRVG